MDEEAIELRPTRWDAAVLLAVLPFVGAGGVWMIFKGDEAGYLLAIGAAVYALDCLYRLFVPDARKLIADRDGLRVNAPLTPIRLKWADIDEFYVGRSRRGSGNMVRIRYSKAYHFAPDRSMASAFGVDAFLLNYYGTSAEMLCELLDSARGRWGQTRASA